MRDCSLARVAQQRQRAYVRLACESSSGKSFLDLMTSSPPLTFFLTFYRCTECKERPPTDPSRLVPAVPSSVQRYAQTLATR